MLSIRHREKAGRPPGSFYAWLFMSKPIHAISILAAFLVTGCANYNIGSQNESEPNGSYAGSTLNSPVTDQNPHPGGDSSYPSSVSDQGKEPVPPDKVDGR
jgi:hypothetical protein